jgi:hypothetical protein
VTPQTICANNDATITLAGRDLDPQTVGLGDAPDMGDPMMVVNARAVTGSGETAMATFGADTLTPRDEPYDLIYTDKNGTRLVLPNAITVVPGITIAAVDPSAAYHGVDFPTSIYGTGMGGVVSATVRLGGGEPVALTGVTAVDANRADAVVPRGLPPGDYDVTVTNADGCTATLPSALKVVGDLTVSVCAIDPAFGWTMEDTDVTITATADGTAGGATCGGKTGRLASSPRAWLVVGGTLRALGNVAFVSAGSVTATVPRGLPPGGPYDLLVQNPDGSVGLLAAAFKVVDQPVPLITSIDPTSIESNVSGTLKIFGRNFRDPVTVEIYNATFAKKIVPSPTVASPTEVRVVSIRRRSAFPSVRTSCA